MLTSRTARWVAGTAMLCLAMLAVSWLVLVSPRRSQAAELREANVAAQNQNDLLEVKIAQLRAQFAKLPERQAELAKILEQMPADAGMPRLVRDLDAMAKSTGVALTSVTPGAAQPLVVAPAAAGVAGPAAAAAAPTGALGSAGTAGPAPAGDAVVAIPVTVVASGDYFQTVAFLKQLQTQMPRAFLVSSVQMAAGSAAATASGATGSATGSATSGQVQVTLSGTVFALPGMSAEALTAAAEATAAATARSPMSAPSGAPTGAPSGSAAATLPATAGSTATPVSPSPTREDS